MKTNSLIGVLAVTGTASAFFTPFQPDHGKEVSHIHARDTSSGWSNLFARAFQADGKSGSNGGSTGKTGSNSEAPKSSSGGSSSGGAGSAGGGAAASKPATGGSGSAAAKPASGSSGQEAAAKPATGGSARGSTGGSIEGSTGGSKGVSTGESSGAAKGGESAKPAGGNGAASAKHVAAPAASHPAAAAPQASHPAAASPQAPKPATGAAGDESAAKPVGQSETKGESSPANSPVAKPAPAQSSPAAGKGASQAAHTAKSNPYGAADKPANSPTSSGAGDNKAQDPFPTGFGGGALSFSIPDATSFPHPTVAPIPTPTHVTPPVSSSGAGSACPAVWTQISKDLQTLFTTGSSDQPGPGQCNDMARAVVRMAFHDCAAWDMSLGTSAGCDGSLYLAHEYTAPEDAGLEQSVPQYAPLASKYGVGVADFIQFGAAVATVVCPLGPTVKTYVGRPDRSTPNPVYLLPNGTDDGPTLVANFAAKGFSAAELVALIGAHTSARQFEFNPAKSGASFDDTPGIWDVRFYSEVLEGNAPFILPSDKALSTYSATAATFKSFVNNQDGWNQAFSDAMTHLSLLGVDTDGLIDCTAALPPPQDNFQEPAGLMTLTEVAKRGIPTGAHYGYHGFHKRYHA